MTRSEGPPHFTPVGYQERIIREADVPAPETISADQVLPAYHARLTIEAPEPHYGDRLAEVQVTGSAMLVNRVITAAAEAFRDEVQR